MVRRFYDRGFTSFHLVGDADVMDPIGRALRQSGAAACGVKPLEAIRIEEGFPVIGFDITDKNLPQEFGRHEKAISFTKELLHSGRKSSPASIAAAHQSASCSAACKLPKRSKCRLAAPS